MCIVSIITKQWNDSFTMDMNFKHFQMWSKNFVTSDWKKSMIFKTLNIVAQKHESNYV
jgi:hypothetical protein